MQRGALILEHTHTGVEQRRVSAVRGVTNECHVGALARQQQTHIHAAPRGGAQQPQRARWGSKIRRGNPQPFARSANQAREHGQHFALTSAGT